MLFCNFFYSRLSWARDLFRIPTSVWRFTTSSVVRAVEQRYFDRPSRRQGSDGEGSRTCRNKQVAVQDRRQSGKVIRSLSHCEQPVRPRSWVYWTHYQKGGRGGSNSKCVFCFYELSMFLFCFRCFFVPASSTRLKTNGTKKFRASWRSSKRTAAAIWRGNASKEKRFEFGFVSSLPRHLSAHRCFQVQVVAVRCIQRNIRKFMAIRQWPWWRLLTKVLPLVEVTRTEEELREKQVDTKCFRDFSHSFKWKRNLET